MTTIQRLKPGDDFPPSSVALDYPNGLLAMGGDLTPERLITAYRHGIFPWYDEGQPILWWTPDPRSLLIPAQLHISQSLRKTLRKDSYRLSVDGHFESVITQCAQTRSAGAGTWISADMISAYTRLHRRGIAHSIEVHNTDGDLVGGLYGLALGRAFFGESMFSLESDVSKIALVALIHIMKRGDFGFIDCQVESDHLNSMGACNVGRLDFEALLRQTVDIDCDPDIWQLPDTSGGLL